MFNGTFTETSKSGPDAGDISNRFLVCLGVFVVIVVLGVPLGYSLYPRIVGRFKKPEKLEIVFRDGFEHKFKKHVRRVTVPREWNSWICSRSHGAVSPGSGGRVGRCLRLEGGSWISGVYREIPADPPVAVECDVRLSSPVYGMKKAQARLSIDTLAMCRNAHRTYGPFVVFDTDGGVRLGFSEPGVKTPFKWKPDRWYRVRLRYEREGRNGRLTLEIDGRQAAEHEAELRGWLLDWRRAKPQAVLHSGRSVTLFDNVRVYKKSK